MRRFTGLCVLLAAGCSGFEAPTDARLQSLPLAPELPTSNHTHTRCRFQMSVDSPWLAGEFDGVVMATHVGANPVLRAQMFGDLGPKMADLVVRPDRIVGFFPQTGEGVDCVMPGEASRHLLVFLGVSLAEEFLRPETPSRVTGIRDEEGGAWLRLMPVVWGTEIHRFMKRGDPTEKKRRLWCTTGVSWVEEWPTPQECRITAPNLSIRVKILERRNAVPTTPFPFELTLPKDVRIVAGSRK